MSEKDNNQYKRLPVVLQTTAVKNFFEYTVDQLYSEANVETLNGFVGTPDWDGVRAQGAYIQEPTTTKQAYALAPTVNTISPESGQPESLIYYDEVVDILKTYGLCPYLDVNLEENSEVKYNNRLEWLKSTDDNGKKYFDCFDDLIEKKSLEQLELQKNIVEKVFTELQLEYFKNSIDFLNEYVNCHIKTKRIKERFKLMINNLSILYLLVNS